jgi:hypothetical protein
MFLRCHARIKDGKEHRYWSVVENRRCGRGKVVQRQVLYLGEINDTQHESWCRTIEVFDDKRERTLPLALFPADRQLPNFAAGFGVQVRLKEMELHRPRQWGACWLACDLYEQLGLDEFWGECLGCSSTRSVRTARWPLCVTRSLDRYETLSLVSMLFA